MAASVKTPSNPWPEIKSAAIPIPQNTSRMTSLGFISGRRRYNSNCTVTSEEQDVTEQEFVPENRVTMGDAFPQTLQKSSQQEMTGKNMPKKMLIMLCLQFIPFQGYHAAVRRAKGRRRQNP